MNSKHIKYIVLGALVIMFGLPALLTGGHITPSQIIESYRPFPSCSVFFCSGLLALLTGSILIRIPLDAHVLRQDPDIQAKEKEAIGTLSFVAAAVLIASYPIFLFLIWLDWTWLYAIVVLLMIGTNSYLLLLGLVILGIPAMLIDIVIQAYTQGEWLLILWTGVTLLSGCCFDGLSQFCLQGVMSTEEAEHAPRPSKDTVRV